MYVGQGPFERDWNLNAFNMVTVNKDENKSEIFDKAIYKLLTDQIKLHASFQPCHFDPNLISQQSKVFNFVVLCKL